MNKYSEYKDSGVEWIGEIPKHWEVKKLKQIISNTEKSFVDGDWIESPYITDEGVRLIQTGNIGIGKYKEQGNRYISELSFRKLNCTEIYFGDVLICRLAQPVGRACLCPNLDEKMITSVDVCILRPNKNTLNKFLVYLLSSNKYLEYADLIARGSTRQRISRTQLGEIKITIPPIEEQEKISNYLDKKTSQIENLIIKKEELIETLKKSRSKLISETVTKGLDKNVSMKDSGVEWIGEIPEHYEIKKLKNLCSYIGRGKSPEYEENTNVFTVNQACLYWNYFKAENIKSVSNKFYNNLNRNHKIQKGDILINSTGGGNLGKSAFFDKTGTLGRVHFYDREENYAYDSHVTMVRMLECHDKKYFYYLFCTKNVHSYIDLYCVNGSTKQIELSKTGLESIFIPVPNKKEQIEISNYLDKKTSQIDNLISKIEEQIEVLKKAKQKLITEVVTGKIDVTNL